MRKYTVQFFQQSPIIARLTNDTVHEIAAFVKISDVVVLADFELDLLFLRRMLRAQNV